MNILTAPAQPSPEYLITLLTDLDVALSVETTGELTFNCPDHIQGDVAVMLRAESFQRLLRDYLAAWHPLIRCVFCGAPVTEGREDTTCIEVRLVGDAHTLDVHGRVICGQSQPNENTNFGGTDELPSPTAARSSRSGHPAAVGSFPS